MSAQPHYPSGNPYEQPEQSYWMDYQAARPRFPDSFFQRIFAYHAANGAVDPDDSSGWQLAHDAGAGPGIHSPRLAEKFDRVLVSDAAEGNVALARAALGASAQASKYEFLVSKFEATAALYPPGSVDLIFSATMLHYCNVPDAMASAAQQLRPGGTLAIALSAIAVLDDAVLQKKWLHLMNAGAEAMYTRFRAAWGEGPWLSATRLNASGYDDVALSEEHFGPGARRVRFGEGDGEGFAGGAWYDVWVPEAFRGQFPQPPSKVRADEVVEFADGGEEWRFEMDLKALRKNLETFPFDTGDEKMVALWKEFEDLVGDRVVSGRWPTRLILATRR